MWRAEMTGKESAKTKVKKSAKAAARGKTSPSDAKFLVVRKKWASSTEMLGKVLQVNSRTIARWEKKVSSPTRPQDTQNIHKLMEILDLGSKVYTEEGLQEFLSTPLAVFNNHSANQLMSIGDYDAVLSALAADYEGLGY
jgi:DNA-binding transcriptional regulator YiaG